MAETTSGDAGGGSLASDTSLAQIQLAQSSEPIGEIREIAGNVGLHRADGTPVVAEVGTPIYQDDSVVTGSDATVEIVFVDGMTFSLGANGNVTIDKLIYNPSGDGNTIDLDVARGAFVFITGQVAPASGEGVNIETPAGVIGVRGTSGACAPGAAWTCAVLPDPVTNHVGRITVANNYGVQVLDTAFESTQASPTTAPSPTQILTPAQATEFFGDPLSLLPEQFPELAPPNRQRDGEPDNPADPDASGLNEINPAADGNESGDDAVDFAQMITPAESLEDAIGSESLGDMMGLEGDQLGSGTERATAGSLGNTESTSSGATASSSRDIPPPEDNFLPVSGENPPPSFSPTSDSNQTSEDGTAGPATGNVLSNDGSQGAARQVVAVEGSSDNVGQPVETKYGVLTLNADGSYTYALDNNDPEVQALAEGEEANDTISYVASNGTTSKEATLTITVTGTNDQPEAVDDGGFSTLHDQSLNLTPASLIENDQDIDGDTLTITSVDNPANGSAVLNDDGSVTYTPNAGYSGTDSFSYTISDGHGGTSTGVVTLEVIGNRPPSAPVDVNDASNTVAEGAAAGTLVGLTAQSTDPDLGDEVTYSLTDDAGGRFQIDATTGEVSVKNGALLDFETAQSHQITVEASDGKLSSSQTFTIGVGDVVENGAPVITSNGGEPTAGVTIAENGTAVTTVQAKDPDAGQKLTYSIVGGADADLFAIDSVTGALSLVNAPDFENPTDQGTDNAYDVIVQASDGVLADTQAIKVSVTNVNEAPSEPVDVNDSPNTVAEGSAAGTLVGLTAQSTDPDLSDEVIYSLTDDAGGRFQIDATTGEVSVKNGALLDFETAQSHQITVQASDGKLSTSQTFSIGVTDVAENGAPTDIALSNASVAENAAGAVIGTVSVSDPDDGDTHTLTVSDSRFEVVDGVLQLKAGQSLDFETSPTVSVDITAKDSGGMSLTETFVIQVTNVNEAPVITSNGGEPVAGVTVAENNTAVTTVQAKDPDAGQKLTYSIVGGADADLFAIDSVTGALSFENPPDFEEPADQGTDNAYDVIVQASDGVLADTQAIKVSVTNVNEAPREPVDANDSPNTVAEGAAAGTLVGLTVQSTDPDLGDEVTYSLTHDAGGRFQIDATTGEVSVKNGALLDFETAQSHQITVQASDGKLSSSQTFTIDVGDVAENGAPVITSNGGEPTAGVTIAENGTAATTVQAKDPDAGQKLTYSIVGGADADLFAIDSVTGALSLVNAPDFENPTDQGTDNAYDVVVQASDGVLADTQAIKVSVSNVNEAPSEPVDANDSPNTVAEGAAAGTLVGLTAQSTDPDLGDEVTYSLTDDAGGRFQIDATTGEVSVKNGALLDFETDQSHQITVQASDGKLSSSQTFTIGVSQPNGTPTAFTDTNSVDEGQQAATNGSAMRTTVTVAAGAVLTLQFNFLDSEPAPDEEFFKDFAVIIIDGQVIKLADVDDASSPIGTSNFAFNEQSGYATFTFTFKTAGTHDIGLAVLNEGDTLYDAGLVVDNVSISGGAFNDGFESGLEGWTTIGNVSAQNAVADVRPPSGEQQALLVSNGVDAGAVEAFLGVPPGALTTIANQPVAIGNVLDNDDFGGDGPGGIVGIVYAGDLSDVSDPDGTTVGNITTITAADGSWQLSIDLTTGDYKFTVLSSIDHPEPGADTLTFAFKYTIADSNGDTSSADLLIDVIDGVPTAFADPQQSVIEGGGNISGNALTNDAFSPDGVTVTQIAFAGSVDFFNVPETGSLSVTTSLGGTLTISADGHWSYKPPADISGTDALEDGFTYVATDGDGDQSSANQSILVQQNADQPPVITSIGDGTGPTVAMAENSTAFATETATHPDAGQNPLSTVVGEALTAVNGATTGIHDFLFGKAADWLAEGDDSGKLIGSDNHFPLSVLVFGEKVLADRIDTIHFAGGSAHLSPPAASTVLANDGIDVGCNAGSIILDTLDVIFGSDAGMLAILCNKDDAVTSTNQSWNKCGPIVIGETYTPCFTGTPGAPAQLGIDTDVSATIS